MLKYSFLRLVIPSLSGEKIKRNFYEIETFKKKYFKIDQHLARHFVY